MHGSMLPVDQALLNHALKHSQLSELVSSVLEKKSDLLIEGEV